MKPLIYIALMASLLSNTIGAADRIQGTLTGKRIDNGYHFDSCRLKRQANGVYAIRSRYKKCQKDWVEICDCQEPSLLLPTTPRFLGSNCDFYLENVCSVMHETYDLNRQIVATAKHVFFVSSDGQRIEIARRKRTWLRKRKIYWHRERFRLQCSEGRATLYIKVDTDVASP